MSTKEHGTLVADANTAVTLTGSGDVLIICHGTGPIYARTDGVAAVKQADETIAVPSNGWRIVHAQDNDGSRVINLISAGTPDFSVESVPDDNNPGIGS